MLTPLMLAGLLLTQTPASAPPPTPAPTTAAPQPATAPTLGELHQAQVEAHLSRLRALQAEVQLQQMVLSAQRDKINAVIAATYPGFRIDWDTGALTPAPPPPAPKATP